ncbi:MAG: FAD-dependent oxidoreductase [Anaerolineae bacterium]|nr:FAD-dependent oxidoreductase [Anaerolineae bacterium]
MAIKTIQATRIVVIGAGYAGLLATVRLAGKVRGQAATVTLINGTDYFIERLRLHQFATHHDFPQRAIADVLRGTGVTFVKGWAARLDPGTHQVTISSETGEQQIGYDILVYALGSTIEIDRVPGVRDFAYTLTPSGARSADALRTMLPELAARHGTVIVAGGGATGIEAAAEFADSYPELQVQLVTQDAFGHFTKPRVANFMRRSLNRQGVTIQDRTSIREVRADGVVTAGGEHLPADLVLWTGGFKALPLARESGLAVNELDQVLIDPLQRSISHPDIYVVGDAMQPVERPGANVRMSALVAVISGAHAADNLAALVHGRPQKPFSFAYMGQGIALGHRNAIGFLNYPNDAPLMPYYTGRLGMAVRELFVKLLFALPAIERRLPGAFLWLGRGRYAAQKRREMRTTRQVGTPVHTQ